MTTRRTGIAARARMSTRAGAAALGVAGGVWGLLVALGALELMQRGVLQPADGRAGQGIGTAAVALALCALAGAAIVRRWPAAACTLLFVASFAGLLVVGGAWIGPGALQFAASWVALVAIENPFAEQMESDRRVKQALEARD